MNISIINELQKISSEEIKLLNDLNDEMITNEKETTNIVSISKCERFLKRDFEEHIEGTIYYMVFGSSRHSINDDLITLKEGEMLFVNKYAHHKIAKLDKDDIAIKISVKEDFKQKCIYENDYLIDFFIKTLFDKDVKIDFIRFEITTVTQITNILENMIYSMLNNENISKNTNISYLNLLLEHIKISYPKLKFSSNAKDVRTTLMVIKFIDENYKDGELKDIADQLAMNPYALSKTVKKMTGFNFKELLQIKKLDTALYLLDRTDTPITKIANEIGYENTSYFHKIFKEKYNVSPKKYRN